MTAKLPSDRAFIRLERPAPVVPCCIDRFRAIAPQPTSNPSWQQAVCFFTTPGESRLGVIAGVDQNETGRTHRVAAGKTARLSRSALAKWLLCPPRLLLPFPQPRHPHESPPRSRLMIRLYLGDQTPLGGPADSFETDIEVHLIQVKTDGKTISAQSRYTARGLIQTPSTCAIP